MTRSRLADLVRNRAGMQLPPQRMTDLTRSVEKMMKRTGFDDETSFTVALETGAASVDELVQDMLIGETYFFREPDQFELVRSQVIPALRALGRPARVWSAGCSSGEEPYSLAILFEEAGVPASIIATDLSREHLEEARAARYGKWSLRGPGADHARMWLDGDQLHRRIRERVVFKSLNLATETMLGRDFDLIFCRNVLIYFEADVIARVGKNLHDALAVGGWLFTASSDPPLGHIGDLQRIEDDVIAYRRVDKAIVHPAVRERTPRPRSRPRPQPRPVTPVPVAVPVAIPAADAQYEAAATLIDQRHDEEARVLLRRAIYLDADFVVAHLALGLLLARCGDRAGARRELGIVKRLCAATAPEAIIPHSGGTCAAQLAGIATSEEARLG